jgi:hypothetical protein
MMIDMDEARLQTISQLCAFVAGTLELQLTIPDSNDRHYAHIATLAQRFGYTRLNRSPTRGPLYRTCTDWLLPTLRLKAQADSG